MSCHGKKGRGCLSTGFEVLGLSDLILGSEGLGFWGFSSHRPEIIY